jgi:hypothetical protein
MPLVSLKLVGEDATTYSMSVCALPRGPRRIL